MLLSGWRQRLLRCPDEASALKAASGVSRPYVDVVLRHNGVAYADFLWRLFDRGMIQFRVADSDAGPSLGFFFTRKSNGKLRLVFDTRMANYDFVAPASTRLPTPGAWGRLESDRPASVHATVSQLLSRPSSGG